MNLEELRKLQDSLFYKGSKTYYNASKAFPAHIRVNVTRLYAFVRMADDFVDQIPQDRDGFFGFKSEFEQKQSLSREELEKDLTIVSDFLLLLREKNFDLAWARAFLSAMESDLGKVECKNIEELTRYTYGSAEVIGLMMCRVLDIPEEAFHAAAMQGRAMQIINFIRDWKEDEGLGRSYLPLGSEALRDPEVFGRSLSDMIAYYISCQNQAYSGYKYIPIQFRVAVATATDMYNWTARKILKEPGIVFKKQVKPKKWRVLLCALKNLIKIRLFKINPQEV